MRDQRGFTLVEMMTVVTIIGVLAIVAIPQYHKFISKARQTEAKASLAMLYMTEQSFKAESGSYTACLSTIGFGLTGNSRYYTIGFHNVDFWDTVCGPANNDVCNVIAWGVGAPPCAAGPGDGVNQFLATASANSQPLPDDTQMNILPTTASGNDFMACAAGAISRSAPTGPFGYDAWCIDYTKNLQNMYSEL